MEADLESKYQSLLKENSSLDEQIEQFRKKGVTSDLQPLMKALHEYNEMKDLTQAVLGYLANVEQVSVSELHVRYNLPLE